MNEKEMHIEGYVETITFRNDENGYSVFTLSTDDEDIVCVGTVTTLKRGAYALIKGYYTEHVKYGIQFKIITYEIKEPSTGEAFLRFVSSGGISGIKKKLGERIVDAFGDKSYDMLLNNPRVVAESVKGISYDRAVAIMNELKENKINNDALIFMQKYEVGEKLAVKIFEFYGERAYDIVKENPYKLAEDIKNVGFKIADSIAQKTGASSNKQNRLRAATLYCIRQSVEKGNTFVWIDQLYELVKQFAEGTTYEEEYEMIKMLTIEKAIISQTVGEDEDEKIRIYLPEYHYMEQSVALRLAKLDITYDIDDFELEETASEAGEKIGISLEESQKEAVKDAIRNGVMVITGGPGTGKTTIINALIKAFEKKGLTIELAAPTGRAAKRMSETTERDAKTIHRLLGFRGGSQVTSGDESDEEFETDNEFTTFERDENNPIDADVLIVDEMSMVDLWLMNVLLKAMREGARLIMVGDADQLPSVGAGNVLKDIAESGIIKVAKLEKIFRQAAESDIVSNAHRINNGEDVDLTKRSKDFLFIRRETPNDIINAIYALVSDKLPKYINADPMDIQILTPSKVTGVGSVKLNVIMQDLFNPADGIKNEIKTMKNVFREGDKVIHIKNDYQAVWTKVDESGLSQEGVGVYNGDTGIIKGIDPMYQTATVCFYDGRVVEYSKEGLNNLDLAYALTVHKSQGSEYPAVVIPMYDFPRMLMNRKLLYTAVTRAKKCVCLVGHESSFRTMEKNESSESRNSSLSEKMKELAYLY